MWCAYSYICYREDINEIVKDRDAGMSKLARADLTTAFIGSTGPLRRLAMANFATKLARLDAIMKMKVVA